jgi:hypothetical protein
MPSSYNFEIGFRNVDFDKYFPKSNIQACPEFHQAKVIFSKDEIEIRIFFESKTYFWYKFGNWILQINREKFGEYINVINPEQNKGIINISFNKSRLLGHSFNTALYEGDYQYLIIKVDWVRIDSAPDEMLINSADFFLNDAGYKLVSEFYLPLSFDKDNFKIIRKNNDHYKIGKSEFRPEFVFNYQDEIV